MGVNKMILRIKSNEISDFSGYKFKNNHCSNTELNKYIDIFLKNEDFCRFDIEDPNGDIRLHTICYVKDRLRNCTMFTQTDLDDNGKPIMYRICFYKE